MRPNFVALVACHMAYATASRGKIQHEADCYKIPALLGHPGTAATSIQCVQGSP